MPLSIIPHPRALEEYSLCPFCQLSNFDGEAFKYPGCSYTPDVVLRGRDLNCFFCVLVFKSMEKDLFETFDQDIQFAFLSNGEGLTVDCLLNGTLQYSYSLDLDIFYYALSTEHTDQSIQDDIGAVFLEKLDDRVMAKSREMISQCYNTHSKCHNSSSNSDNLGSNSVLGSNLAHKPGRLVDLGEDFRTREFSNSSRVSLIETKLDVPYEYAALSHCWGMTDIECSTSIRNHVDRLKNGITFGELAQNFKDACFVAQKLHIRYIWIDSLCIIQGDTEDFMKEGSKMDSVYSNCIVCISATVAECATDGFLHQREPPKILMLRLEDSQVDSESDNEDEPGSQHKPVSAVLVYTSSNAYEEAFFTGPPQARAWTFQERFLSPRTLHFTSDELFFVCCTHKVSEIKFSSTIRRNAQSHYTFDNMMEILYGYPVKMPKLIDPETKEEAVSVLHILQSFWWPSAVSQYSSGRLTKKSDREIALRGLKSYISSYVLRVTIKFDLFPNNVDAADYCHHQFILYCLAWKPCQPLDPSEIFTSSWSWLSHKGSCKFYPSGNDNQDPMLMPRVLTCERISKQDTELYHLTIQCVHFRIHIPSMADLFSTALACPKISDVGELWMKFKTLNLSGPFNQLVKELPSRYEDESFSPHLVIDAGQWSMSFPIKPGCSLDTPPTNVSDTVESAQIYFDNPPAMLAATLHLEGIWIHDRAFILVRQAVSGNEYIRVGVGYDFMGGLHQVMLVYSKWLDRRTTTLV